MTQLEPSTEEIHNLWRNPKFSGAFSGIRTFKSCLALEKNINIPEKKLFDIMRKDPDFVLEMKKIRKTFVRRPLRLHGVGLLWQADLAIMPEQENFIGFLLCVDLFSRKIFCESLLSKDAKSVRIAFQKIFKRADLFPEKLETDQGKEFVGNKKYFKQKKIFFKIKTGRHKAAFAEKAIQIVKLRLYRLMRTKMTTNWPVFLQDIVKAINNSPNSAIGGLLPASITTPEDGPKIDKRIGLAEDISFEDQKRNQEKYKQESKIFQAGDHVYADFGPSPFEKSFDTKNYQLYRILRVDAGKNPPLYKLVDLAGDEIPGYFYKEQLTRGEEPKDGETFRVESILKEKVKGKQDLVYVKFMHYPAKFNKWIPRSNITK